MFVYYSQFEVLAEKLLSDPRVLEVWNRDDQSMILEFGASNVLHMNANAVTRATDFFGAFF